MNDTLKIERSEGTVRLTGPFGLYETTHEHYRAWDYESALRRFEALWEGYDLERESPSSRMVLDLAQEGDEFARAAIRVMAADSSPDETPS